MSSTAQIRTERLILKPVTLDDAAFILELQNMPKWLKYIGDRNLRVVEDAELYIKAKMLTHFKQYGYGNYVICDKETGAKMGTCGMFHRPGLEVVDIGFALLPPYEGKGFASEAATALLNIAKSSFELEKVSAIVLPENEASVRLIKMLGFNYVKKVQLPGDEDWLDYYEIEFVK